MAATTGDLAKTLLDMTLAGKLEWRQDLYGFEFETKVDDIKVYFFVATQRERRLFAKDLIKEAYQVRTTAGSWESLPDLELGRDLHKAITGNIRNQKEAFHESIRNQVIKKLKNL